MAEAEVKVGLPHDYTEYHDGTVQRHSFDLVFYESGHQLPKPLSSMADLLSWLLGAFWLLADGLHTQLCHMCGSLLCLTLLPWCKDIKPSATHEHYLEVISPGPCTFLQVLHTLALNGNSVVRDQITGSKLFETLKKILAKPLYPGLELAVAQLLLDWAYLYQ